MTPSETNLLLFLLAVGLVCLGFDLLGHLADLFAVRLSVTQLEED